MQGNAPKKATGLARRRLKRTEATPISKIVWEPGTMLNPVPVVLVSVQDADGPPNLCTVAWTGTVCSEPPMVAIALRPSRLTYDILMRTRECVVNVPTPHLIRATDYCGCVSGRDVDKFEKTGLTPAPSSKVHAPLILECPINLECVVRQILELGIHTLFIAEVLAVQVSEHLVSPSGRLAWEKEGLAAFAHGGYYALGKKLGNFGFSVKKEKPRAGKE